MADPFEDHLRRVVVAEFWEYAFPFLAEKYNWKKEDAERFVADPEQTTMALSSHVEDGKKYLEKKKRDADAARNDKFKDDKIILGENPADGQLKMAQHGVKVAKSIENLVEWFAAFPWKGAIAGSRLAQELNLEQVKKTQEAVREYRAAMIIYQDKNASIDDRMDAAKKINAIANMGGPWRLSALETLIGNGKSINLVNQPLYDNEYADLKLSRVKDAAKGLMTELKAHEEEVVTATAQRNQKLEERNNAIKEIADRYNALVEEAKIRLGWKEQISKIDEVSAESKKRIDALTAEIAEKFGNSVGRNESEYAEYETLIEKRLDLQRENKKKLGDIQNELRRIIDAAYDETAAEQEVYEAEGIKYQKAANASADRVKAAVDTLHAEVTGKVMANSPVTPEAAESWFKGLVMLDKRTQTALKRRNYDLVQFKADMLEFYRMTGGRLSRITFDIKGGQRAAASVHLGVIYISGNFTKQTLWHELAHVLEDDKGTVELSRRFLDQRTGREGGVRPESLDAIWRQRGYKSTNYAPNEIAWADSFIDPYVGKSYRDGITEVFSMGMQYFSSPEAMAELREKDPEHFEFMLGYMLEKPRLDGEKIARQQVAQAEKKGDAETTEEIFKAIDKKIAAAGDFWTEKGLQYDARYREKSVWNKETFDWDRVKASRPYSVEIYYPSDREGYKHVARFKAESAAKRAMWLHITNGMPKDGEFSLWNLGQVLSAKGSKVLPKSILLQSDAIVSGGL